MKITNIYKTTAALIFLMVAALWPAAEAWGQEYGDRYETVGGDQWPEVTGVTIESSSSVTDTEKIFSNYSYATIQAGRRGTIVLNVGQNSSVKRISFSFIRYNNRYYRPSSITVSTSDNYNSGFVEIGSASNISNTTTLTIDFNQSARQYIRLEINAQSQRATYIYNTKLYAEPTSDLPSIQHKPAKWHNLREQSGNRFVDDFSDGEEFFTYQKSPGSTELTYQAAHTIVDTLYVRKGSSIVLALPDRREGFDTDDAATNIGSYQCWFNFRTGRIFNTSTSGNVDDRVVDLLTPTTNGDTYYRFQNGYINRPLVNWDGALPARMTFYYPSDDQFNNSGYKPDGQTDNRYYLVACDLSGYMDFSADGSTASFGAGGTYYEPTLTHRVIYYIVGVDGTWDRPLEEYEIDFPAYTLPNKSNEMVALSMDARSYLAGTNTTSLTATIDNSNNTAGIELVYGNNKDLSPTTTTTVNSVTLTGDDRSIFFRMPNKNDTDGSRYVKNINNNPTATINVHAGNTLVAKFTLNFKNESRLLTQSIVNDLNNGSVTQGATWENLDYRTPESLTNEHTLLTKLDFDYESSYVTRNLFYPYPLSWGSNTYGFYDGSNESNFMGGGATNFYYPEYSSYSLLRSDGGYVESNTSWGWRGGGFVQGSAPTNILQNSEENNSTYHLFVDASDRPGLIARLSFEENLCAGSVLYVSAWVKTARWDNSCDNAAVLFTIMGVTKDEDGKETFIPIHRYQTGQIPATYGNMNTYGLNIDGLGDNEWMQAYFSFTNSSELSFDHYVLQVDNNSPSTKGGDIYLDDIRVYISKPLAEVTQLETACSTERTLMNLKLDWDRFMARVGNEGVAETRNLGICFIDTLLFHNNFDPNRDDPNLAHFKEAMEKSAVHLGQDEQNSYEFRALFYNSTFDSNTSYEKGKEGGNLAAQNPINKDGFYAYTSKDGTSKALAVDFYGDLIPGRTYWIVLVPDPASNEVGGIHMVDPTVFAGFYNDPCAIKADFHVTGNTTIKIDGEIVTPETEFCKGHVNNFTVELQVPHGDGGGEMVMVPADAVYFDWFFGENREGQIADPQAQYVEINETYGVSLQDALVTFRNFYPNATTLSETETPPVKGTEAGENDFTEEMYNLIDHYLNTVQAPEGAQNRPLVLHQPSLNITLLDEMRVVICPIPLSVSEEIMEELGYTEQEWKGNLCWGYTYLELTTTNAAPTVYPGFNTVAYPTDLSGQSLRIGLDQINLVKREKNNTNTKTLTVDLRDAKSYKTTNPENPYKDFTLQRIGGDTPDETYNKLFLTDTDDPVMKAFIDKQGDSFDRRSLPIGEVEFFEAHYYGEGTTGKVNKMEVQFILDKQSVLINGNSEDFTFAPREGYYYTFNVYFEEYEAGGATACYGRFPLTMKVVPEYLVWNDTQKKDDYSTIGNWNYDGNWLRATNADIKATNTIDEYKNDNRAFVPMLFSKVVIPANSKIWLYQAGYGDNGKWNNEDRPAEVADPTPNIQYDLMAFESGSPLKTERYRVSLLNQIHFEPGAEMLHAEYLLYDTAWVDYQLDKGRWYTLASPLKAVYAGDFYTDKSGTEGSEYFQPIEFKYGTNSTDNNRFSPSVYQRAWKGSAAMMVIGNNQNNEERAIAGNWSALYNDVAEAYTPGTGFSLKVQDVTGNATFRLPKADGSYKYYSYDGKTSGDPTTISRDVDASGRLKSDELLDRRTDNASLNTSFTIELADAHGGYYLVGNPFMAHLDMDAFFKKQTFNNIQINNGAVLAWKYWYLDDDGTQVAVSYDEENDVWTSTKTTGDDFLIPPLRSFFVVKNADAEESVIKFTQEMQTLGGNGDGLRSANALTITATTTDGRTSRAAVAYDMAASADYEASEDAELFLDSNLGDVPMVYTVAGTMATSINRTSELYNIPLGVYGNKQEMVTLSFGGLNQFSSATLYDAQEQTETPLHEGKTVSVPAGTSGRYFLRAGTPTGNEVIARNAFLVYSVGGGKVMVTSSNTPLKDIRVYTMGGAQVRSIQASGMQQEIYLNRGIYLITVSDQDGLQETRKVLVR